MKTGRLKTEKKNCVHCGRRLAPEFKYETRRVETEDGHRTDFVKIGIYGYGYGSNNFFCTKSCGWAFALKIARKNYG